MEDNIDNETEERITLDYTIIFKIIGLISAIYGAYLSWSCTGNSNFLFRILYAILAFGFGWIYIIYYYLFSNCSSDN